MLGLRAWLRDLPRRIGYGRGPRLMSALRKRWVLLRHPHVRISFGEGVYLGPGFSLHMSEGGEFIVGSGVEFRRNFRCEIWGSGRVVIGADSFLTYDVIIACSTTIEIGERVGIGQAAFVVDGNHRYRNVDVPFLDRGYSTRPLRIADDVAIHSKCTIIADIGEHAVIAANSVVTKAVPAFTLAGGVPARALDYFGPPGQEPPELVERRAAQT